MSLLTVEILLVEDSPTDRLITERALQQISIPNRLHIATDGVRALDFVRRHGEFETAPRPDLILLDLNLPRIDGREVLSELKTDSALKMIPVIVLTSSRDQEDIAQAYSLHANCYIAKPSDFATFRRTVTALQEFWFQVVRLPASNDRC